jgi:hypothetical protein
VEEGATRRIFVADSRGGDRYLRVTWHPDTETVVFSHWVGDVCVASTPVAMGDAKKLVRMLGGIGAPPSGAAATGRPEYTIGYSSGDRIA